MKKNNFLIGIAMMLAAAISLDDAKAQIGRNDWSCELLIYSDNTVYSALSNANIAPPTTVTITNEDREQTEQVGNFLSKNSWWIPDVRYRVNVVQKLEFTGELGFTNTETHMSWLLLYGHSFYDFYNKDFIYEGFPIYEGSKSAFGKLGVAVSYAF